ncbi:hypothetical protein P7F88_10985 [Vibrio hannami]|nr:hypothetical protein [Vibrio hannami]MDG3086608.1 hypothetical protein [Vibrio hannami]
MKEITKSWDRDCRRHLYTADRPGDCSVFRKKENSRRQKEKWGKHHLRWVCSASLRAIPFAACKPLRDPEGIMAGSMTGSVIAMIGNVGDRVLTAGSIVAVLGAVDHVLMFFVLPLLPDLLSLLF